MITIKGLLTLAGCRSPICWCWVTLRNSHLNSFRRSIKETAGHVDSVTPDCITQTSVILVFLYLPGLKGLVNNYHQGALLYSVSLVR